MSIERIDSDSEVLDADRVLSVAHDQIKNLITRNPGRIPIYTVDGRWHFDDDSWAPIWTGGFLAGLVWIVAVHTDDPWWRRQAEHYTELLEPRKHDAATHDLGFLFSPSWARWHAVDPSPKTRDVLIQAGRTLASNFNPGGRYLKTWVALLPAA